MRRVTVPRSLSLSDCVGLCERAGLVPLIFDALHVHIADREIVSTGLLLLRDMVRIPDVAETVMKVDGIRTLLKAAKLYVCWVLQLAVAL